MKGDFLSPYYTGKLLLKHMQKLISHGNTEITEEINFFFRVFRASVANIMLRHAQKEEKLSEKSLKAITLPYYMKPKEYEQFLQMEILQIRNNLSHY